MFLIIQLILWVYHSYLILFYKIKNDYFYYNIKYNCNYNYNNDINYNYNYNNDINCNYNYNNDINYNYLDLIFYFTLKYYFDKYNLDYNFITYKSTGIINNYNNYNIESRGDGFGICVINHINMDINMDINSITVYNFKDLLQLKVSIYTWNKYKWCKKEFNEKEIIIDIYNCILKIYNFYL